MSEAHFDDYSEKYDSALADSLSATGEDKDFFARGRASFVAKCLQKQNAQPASAMDYGCGIGSTTPHLLELLKVQSVIGIDVSSKCLDVAAEKFGSSQISFVPVHEFIPREEIDVVYTSGVFHHIKEEQDEMFPKVRKAKLDTAALGAELLERKQELQAELGIGEAEEGEEEGDEEEAVTAGQGKPASRTSKARAAK